MDEADTLSADCDFDLLSGWSGHHEVVIPTAVSYLGMKIEDFGGNGEYVRLGNENRFYDNTTMDYRSVECGLEYDDPKEVVVMLFLL